ncbi:MAG: IGHMBP2 family helicase [Thermodesulfobacteria bacterium]|nr:IGHMBP2 family helicase [Thermodesulfobacteriota bacterium]
MPILVHGVYDYSQLKKELKRLKLRASQIKACFFANQCALLFFKDEALCRYYQDLIPPSNLVKEIRLVHEYVEKYKALIEEERRAEMEFQKEEIKRLSGRERELLGRAILNLKGTKAGSKFHLYLVRFFREKPIDTEISTGDVVLISRGNPLKSDLIGTVVKITERTITVAFENKPPKWVYKKGVRIDLYVNDITFKRMEENLEVLRHAIGRQRELRNILLGLKPPEPAEEVDFTPIDENLNEVQKKAVAKCLGAKDFFLVHGPPGTGKTRTLTELIVQLVKRGKRVLATADSNIAADNLILGLRKYPELKIVRIGHPARVMEELEEYSIFALFERHEEAKKLKDSWEGVRELMEKRDAYKKPIPQIRRGLSDDEILFLAQKGKGARGVSKESIRSMANWIVLNYEIEDRFQELKEMEKQLFNKIILNADVVVSTNSMVLSDFLKDFSFDVAVIDEGSQQVEPSTLIPIMKASCFYIAGDHKQLPPTVLSEKAKELENTLFERLVKNFPELSVMLEVQYRMNEKIMNFPNEHFYEGKLKAHPTVKTHTLADLKVGTPEKFIEVLDPKEPIAFIDTKEFNAVEFQPEGSTSFENQGEAIIVDDLVRELLKMGVNKDWIGIITPYAAQVKLLKQMFLEKGLKIEVNSVDGFQGREKEVIIISFVRSNEKGELGFLKDLRRLNVAITRARRKLIAIGNSETLSNHPVYQDFIEYIKKNGVYYLM